MAKSYARMSVEMACSVLGLSFESLRSKSRLRSQLGFLGWIFVKSCSQMAS